MRRLCVRVEEVRGVCTAKVPMREGTAFAVENGRLHAPGGGPICLFALQSLLPLLPAKERDLGTGSDTDWLWRVHHAQCPDPKGRVVWRIEEGSGSEETAPPPGIPAPVAGDLIVAIEEVRGRCTSGMKPGMWLLLKDSSLYFPQPFCLYALAAVLPLLPAASRPLAPDDWLATENAVICPDPNGNVIMRFTQANPSSAPDGAVRS